MNTDYNKLEEAQRALDALQAVQAEQAEVAAQIVAMPRKYDGSTTLPQDHTASQATSSEIERAQVLRDPWAGQDALEILRHPPGKRLQWISPQYRERRGMRGWEPVRHDDAIGRELHLYINDPPSRMEGMAQLTEVVRRGDVVLAWIDEGIYQSRRDTSLRKANRNLNQATQRGNQPVGKFGRTTDEGLRDDPDSKYRYKPRPGMVSPRTGADYRNQAKGTVHDDRIAVEGRRLFGEPGSQE